jgi:hypothetical protein
MHQRFVKQILAPLAILSILLFSQCSALLGQQWELVGTKNINYTLEKDVIGISKATGSYQSLKLIVKRSPLKVNKLIVTYADGQKQEFNIGKEIAMGQESSVFNLPTGGRTLKKVEITYDKKGSAGSKAGVELWGKK